jgi:dinuclear metal center YbgI/SA1388 family protein
MDFDAFLALLERSAPLALAEEWDNVGLLLAPRERRALRRVLLTVDLTLAVAEEAVQSGAELVVAYHPPIFASCKRIVPSDRTGNILLTLLEQRIAVYSPHTALDAVDGGVNDWLASAFDFVHKEAIVPKGERLGQVNPRVGQGRRLELGSSQPLDLVLARLKQHLGLAQLRVAGAAQLPSGLIRTVALCAGAGAQVLKAARADLYLTGEMRHHDVLELCGNGGCVVLTEHSNSERGYLPELALALRAQLSEPVELLLSREDSDPLSIV